LPRFFLRAPPLIRNAGHKERGGGVMTKEKDRAGKEGEGTEGPILRVIWPGLGFLGGGPRPVLHLLYDAASDLRIPQMSDFSTILKKSHDRGPSPDPGTSEAPGRTTARDPST
jgi:hypothetical protein